MVNKYYVKNKIIFHALFYVEQYIFKLRPEKYTCKYTYKYTCKCVYLIRPIHISYIEFFKKYKFEKQ